MLKSLGHRVRATFYFAQFLWATIALGQVEPPIWPPKGTFQPTRIESVALEPIDGWRYVYETATDTIWLGTSVSLGRIGFHREDSVPDALHERVYQRGWYPGMTFTIYPLATYSDCLKAQDRVRVFSSCLEPNVGGDLFVVGEFLLFNYDDCLSCSKEDGIDRCRGPISEMIKIMGSKAPETLDELLMSIPVTKKEP